MPTSLISPKQYSMKQEGPEKNIMKYLNQERKINGNRTCEVVLLASNVKHYAHKIVLVSFSDYFRNYFEEKAEEESLNGKVSSAESEKDSEKCKSDDEILSQKSDATSESSSICRSQVFTTITLPGINAGELGPILDYMYTSELVLKADNVNEILLAGCLLQISSVIELCAKVLLEQPTWRSPLVSPKLFSLPTDRVARTLAQEVVSSSHTAVTWATNGVRPMPHEIQSQSRGRIGTSSAQNDDANSIADSSRQNRVPMAPSARTRKRRRQEPQRSSEARAIQRGRRSNSNVKAFESVSVGTTTMEERQQEFLADIDFAELDRELRMNARRYQSQRRNLPRDTSLSRSQPFSDVINYSAKRSNAPSSIDEAIGVKYFEPRYHSSRDDIKSAHAINSTIDNQPITMFPQMDDNNRNLAAFCFPAFHPSYFGLTALNPVTRLRYPPTIPGAALQEAACEKVPNNDFSKVVFLPKQAKSFEGNISSHRRFPASIAEVYGNSPSIQRQGGTDFGRRSVGMFEPRSYVNPSLKVESALHLSGFEENQISPEVPSRFLFPPGVKRFCPDVIQHMDTFNTTHKDWNISQCPTDMSYLSLGARTPCGKEKHQLSKQIIATAARGKSGIVLRNSEKECCKETCGTSSAIDSRSSTHDHVNVRNGSQFNYPIRKRKLLQAVEELSKYDKLGQVNTNKPTGSVQKVQSLKTTKCSSEDDIIARECHNPDASDLDSDDSGRASSV